MFYERLFQSDPALRRLFRGNMEEQGARLMRMIAVAVRGLNDPGRLLPAVRQLGVRHATYGVQPEHYETVGAALLWTLERGLGPRFTPEVSEDWVAVDGY